MFAFVSCDHTGFWGLATSFLLWMAEETSAALELFLPASFSTASIVLGFCIRLEAEIDDHFQQFPETQNPTYSEDRGSLYFYSVSLIFEFFPSCSLAQVV